MIFAQFFDFGSSKCFTFSFSLRPFLSLFCHLSFNQPLFHSMPFVPLMNAFKNLLPFHIRQSRYQNVTWSMNDSESCFFFCLLYVAALSLHFANAISSPNDSFRYK